MWILIFIGLYQPVMAGETITFEEILDKAITNSYELKISKIDIRLSKYAIGELKSLYFPIIKARFNTEYSKDLTGGVDGITSITDNTRFQDSFAVNLSYELLGTRRKKRLLSKKELKRQELIYQNNLKNLKLRILELYTQTLLTYKELEAKKEIFSLQKELLQLKERLFKSRIISRIELANEVIGLANVMTEVEKLGINLGLMLEDITFYTGEHYELGVGISDFEVGKEVNFPSFKPQTIDPEIRIYEKGIEKKRIELGILRRERLPQAGLYSNYTLYGSDRDKPKKALGDLEERDWVVGISIDVPLFQGFKTFTQEKILKLEIEKLQLERDKKTAELKSLYAKEGRTLQGLKQEIETKKELLKKVQDKTDMVERLSNQQITDKVVFLNQKIGLISEQLEVKKTTVSKLASIRRLNIYFQFP